MEFEYLKIGELVLRKISDVELKHIHEHCSKADQMYYLGAKDDAQWQAQRQRYEEGLTSYQKRFLYFQILDPKHDSMIGWCGFHTWYVNHSRAEIGYEIFDEAYKRKGIMSKVLHTIIPYGFEQMDLMRIEAFVEPNNTPSLRLMEKFHFVEEGCLRKHYYKNGQWEDSAVFGLLREEFG